MSILPQNNVDEKEIYGVELQIDRYSVPNARRTSRPSRTSSGNVVKLLRLQSGGKGRGAKSARKRSTEKVLGKHAIARPLDLKSSIPNKVVKFDTIYINVPNTNQFICQIIAICCLSKLSWSFTFVAVTTMNTRCLLHKVLRQAPFRVLAVQTRE